MTKTEIIFLVLTIILGVAGILPHVLSFVLKKVKQRKIRKMLIPQKVDKNQLCKGLHQWTDIRVLTEEGDSTVNICKICGFISGTNLMASQESIDAIEEGKKIKEIEDRIFEDFVLKDDESMKKLLEKELLAGLSYDKIILIHQLGMTFDKRYEAHRTAMEDEVQKEIKRGNA